MSIMMNHTNRIPATRIVVDVTTMPLHESNTLRTATVATRTLDMYESAVEQFLSFCRHHQLSGNTTEEVDNHLSIFIESLYINNVPGGKQKAANALFGILRRCPQLRTCFPLSRQCIKGYNKLVPSISWVPVPWYCAVAIASVLAKSGYFNAAVGTLVAFHCHLRISELISLTVHDVAVVGDLRLTDGGCTGALRIAKAKTGLNQFVTVTDPNIQKLLDCVITGRAKNERVFKFTADAYRMLFKRARLLLQLNDDRMTAHSLRHGGASHDQLRGVSIEDIMVRGRWNSNAATRRYLQALRAILLTTTIPRQVYDIGRTCSADLVNNLLSLRNN